MAKFQKLESLLGVQYAKSFIFVIPFKEDIPTKTKKAIFPCVWRKVLRTNTWSEVNAWFDRLTSYMIFLTKNLISSSEVQNATCLSFQKL